MLRYCYKCKLYKDILEFNYKNIKLNLRQKECKSCKYFLNKSYVSRNKEKHLTNVKRNTKDKISKNREYIISYLQDKSCIDCGENDIRLLEFDHIENKEQEISIMIKDSNLTKIKKEVEKCEIRCGNCHVRKTNKQFNWYKYKWLEYKEVCKFN